MEKQFPELPPSFHSTLRKHLTTNVKCSECKKPQCSCSGFHRAEVVFLPGERAWIETRVAMLGRETRFRGQSNDTFPVCGDCTFLDENKACSLGVIKPWDCLSFPFQPQLVQGKLIPSFAENCYFSPAKLDPLWIKQIWEGWQYIETMVSKEWLAYYCGVPAHE